MNTATKAFKTNSEAKVKNAKLNIHANSDGHRATPISTTKKDFKPVYLNTVNTRGNTNLVGERRKTDGSSIARKIE